MVSKCIVHMHITAELKPYWLTYSWYICVSHVTAWVTVRTRENCCLKMAFTLFELLSKGKDLRHLMTTPWAFLKVNSLGFLLVTAAVFCNFKIWSQYNPGLPSGVGILSIKEHFEWFLWDWWITCNAHALSVCVNCWQCNKSIRELFIAVMLCSNWWCCWEHW